MILKSLLTMTLTIENIKKRIVVNFKQYLNWVDSTEMFRTMF